MFAILKESRLADGRRLQVVRFVPPGDYPLAMWRYLMEAFKCDDYRHAFIQHAYWQLDYRERLEGNYAEYCEDYFYCALVDDVYAASLWFGYAKRSGRGNFGNVYTRPAYRGLGLMKELLQWCVADFDSGSAKMICCASGVPHAVASYRKVGFEMIYGGDRGPMCLMKTAKEQSFLAAADAAFAGQAITCIRPGNPGDQFDCDKFLFYTPSVYQEGRHRRRGPSGQVGDYRMVWQEVLQGNGVQLVAENNFGTVVAYAHALCFQGHSILDFTAHGNYVDHVPMLLQATTKAFQEKIKTPLFFYATPADQEKIAILEQAGGKLTAQLPSALWQGANTADLLVYQLSCCQ